MKKILIVVMGCNDNGFFDNQVKVIKETWVKDILDNKYPNIDFIYYKGWDDEHTYDPEDKCLYVRCEDDLDNCFKKTFYAFSLIDNNFEYDYIFRTNTSTYINIHLLNEFVQQLDNDEILYGSDLYSLTEACCPYPCDLYSRGNGILFSKKIVKILLKESINMIYLKHCDDWIIGNIINSYWIKQGKDYRNYIKGFTHGWYKTIDIPKSVGNKISKYNDSELNFDHYKNFISIQIKQYPIGKDRSDEVISYYELYDLFSKNNDYDYKKSLNFINEYSKNPSVFIGSILGYIDYELWVNIPREDLYNTEINNKACDDIENKNKKIMPLY